MNNQYKEQISRLHTSENFEKNTIAMLETQAGKDKAMFKNKTVRIILAAIIGIILLSGTVFAIVHHITASDVAILVNNDNALAEAFKSDDAKVVNQTITAGEYEITLLGMVSGKQLTNWEKNGKIDTESTYIAVMVSYADGKKIEYAAETEGEHQNPYFAISFDGVAPWMYSVDGFSATYIDGFAYYLIDAVNLEPFADRNVKLYAFDGHASPSNEVFSFNSETGKTTYNEKYEGIKASFDLPLDKSKANAEEASRILNEWHIPQP